MKDEKFSHTMFDGFLEDGEKIGIFEVLLYLNKLNEFKQLLEEIKIELSELDRYKAFKAYYGGMGRYEVLVDDVIDLNFHELISRIDEVISDV